MSNVIYDFSTFTVTDFRGDVNTLSSYNLPITPLTFTPLIPSYIRTDARLVWDFGDGNISTETIPTHSYKQPGDYNVRLYVFNGSDQALLATDTYNVYIKEYLQDTFNIITGNNTALTGLDGQLSDPLIITQTIPVNSLSARQQTTLSINSSSEIEKPIPGFLPASLRPALTSDEIYTQTSEAIPVSAYEKQIISSLKYIVSGSNTNTFFDLSPDIYNHLIPYNSIIKKEFIPSLSSFELINVADITIPLSAIYVKLEGTTLVESLTADETSLIVGYSGSDTFYYRDDLPTNNFNIFFFRPTSNNITPLGITLSGYINENTLLNRLSITSNGIDGDSEPLNTFSINYDKFANTKIHFVVKIKDEYNNTVKNFSNEDIASELIVSLSSVQGISTSEYSVSSLYSKVSAAPDGGVYRGFITYDGTLITPLTGVVISARWNTPTNLNSTSFATLLGASNSFNIFPNNYYTLYKKGEDFDAEAIFKSLRFQETLLDKDVFFTDFLGTIFGNISSEPDTLGKKIYEKIQNFIDNTTNINTSDISRFLSLGDMMDFKSTVFDKNLINFPNKIQRIVSLLSINRDKLFGYQNKFIENFNSYGHLTKDVFGKNLGDILNLNTSTIKPSANIVCYEKFSRKYKILNTYQPLCGEVPPVINITTGGYNLSSYNSTWGWPLVLPSTYITQDINNYYTFYNLTPDVAGNIVGGVLDLNLTNISYDIATKELTKDGGIYENIIINTLIDALQLTK
jgi:PKD repeat protein